MQSNLFTTPTKMAGMPIKTAFGKQKLPVNCNMISRQGETNLNGAKIMAAQDKGFLKGNSIDMFNLSM